MRCTGCILRGLEECTRLQELELEGSDDELTWLVAQGLDIQGAEPEPEVSALEVGACKHPALVFA